MPIYISPYSTTDSCPLPHDFATKVRLFWERFHGWKFEVALKMLNGYQQDGEEIRPIKDSGYVAMDCLFSYFEPYGKHLHGYLDTDKANPRSSGTYFKRGVENVFGISESQHDEKGLIDCLWKEVRNGLYHAGRPGSNVLVGGGREEALSFATEKGIVIVDPHKLAEGLIYHVADYRDRLLAEGEASSIGSNFLKRYDFEENLGVI